ncbi:hypothetical protein SANTM175S_08948 [Streptomyces antimycoticus]
MASLSTPLTLPVLPLDDEVVLPGMVVPLDLSDTEVRAAVEAAQAAARSSGSGSGKPKVLLVPRVDGTYAGIGTLGTIEQVGRLSDGDPGALIRGVRRVRIGAGTTGPGAALWVEGTTVEEIVPDPLPGAVTELIKEYKALAYQLAAQARRLAGRGPGGADRRCRAARRQLRLLALPERGPARRAAGDHRPGGPAEARRHLAAAITSPNRTSPSRSPRTSRRASTSSSASSCCGASSKPSVRSSPS